MASTNLNILSITQLNQCHLQVMTWRSGRFSSITLAFHRLCPVQKFIIMLFSPNFALTSRFFYLFFNVFAIDFFRQITKNAPSPTYEKVPTGSSRYPSKNVRTFIFQQSGVSCSSISFFPLQDVFLMIRRKKVTVFTDAKESTTVLEVKKIVEGIVKQKTEDQRLFKDEQVMVLLI